MAKVRRLLHPMQGTIGNITFYRHPDGGTVAKLKSGLSRERVLHHPDFARTRENSSEFSNASKAASALLDGLCEPLAFIRDRKCFRQLLSRMVKAARTDAISPRGERIALRGNLRLLEGFECNQGCFVSERLTVPATGNADRAQGTLSVSIPGFVPRMRINAPRGATHMQLFATAIATDLEGVHPASEPVRSEMIEVRRDAAGPLTLETQLPPDDTLPWLLVLGVEFFMAAGNTWLRTDKAGNAAAILRVFPAGEQIV